MKGRPAPLVTVHPGRSFAGVVTSTMTSKGPWWKGYDGRQVVGVDVHRRRSVIVTATASTEQPRSRAHGTNLSQGQGRGKR